MKQRFSPCITASGWSRSFVLSALAMTAALSMTAALALPAAPAFAQSVEDELRELERELDAASPPEDDAPDQPAPTTPPPAAPVPGAGALQSMNPDIALVADFALGWFSGDHALTGGHDPTATGFNLQGLELSFQAAVDPFFRFDSHIVLGLFGLEIEEVYGTTTALPFGLQARVGQFLTRFGRLNPTHLHQWHFVTQPIVIGKFFGGEGLRGLGVELGQLLPLPWYAAWTVSAQNLASASTARSFLPSSDDIEHLTDLSVAGRLEQFFELSDSLGLLWGLSAANGPNGTGRGNRTDIYGTDLLLKWNPARAGGAFEIGWQTEVLLRRRQSPGPLSEPDGTVLQDFGGYTHLYLRPDRVWQYGARYELVTGVEGDDLDPQWDDDRHRLAANVTYFPSHFSRLRLEYGVDWLRYLDTSDEHELVHMVLLQLELVVGAHGSHSY